MEDSDSVAAIAPAYNVVGFAGSLRRGSYNRALLRAATELAPPALHIEIHELDGIPLYNGDIEAAGAPPSVVELREAIRKADGLLIATPEYNHGVPGVLKNTIDWLSRPPGNSSLNAKVAAVMGASPGMTGTARGQSQLRQAFVFTNTYALLQPEVLVAKAHEKFDADGRLVHQATREFLGTFLQRFADLIALHAACCRKSAKGSSASEPPATDDALSEFEKARPRLFGVLSHPEK